MSDMDAAKYAGEVFMRLIKEHNLTQEYVALSLCMDLRTVSRYVNKGINQVTTIQHLAEFFDVDMRIFFPNTTANGGM